MRWVHTFVGIAACVVLAYCSVFQFDAVPDTTHDRTLNTEALTEPLKIAFVGTSLTASYEWSKKLEDCSNHRIQTIKIAQNGASSDWGVSQVDLIIESFPDIVFIEFSINDADWRQGVSIRKSRTNHFNIIDRIRENLPHTKIVLMTMNPAYGLRSMLRPRLPSYYALYTELSVTHDLGLLDLYTRWLKLPKELRILTDGLHPSIDAADSVILPEIKSYLGLTC